jgi:hypothetical protein
MAKTGEGIDVYYTTKGVYLYAICMSWPGNEFKLKDVYAAKGSTVQLLGGAGNITFINESDGLTINYLDSNHPESNAYTFKIKITEGANVMYFNDGSLDQTTTLVHPVVFDKAGNIDFRWYDGTPDIKIGSRTKGENNFSACYEGTITVKEGALYSFRIVADDGVRFWINDGQGKRATIERWHDNSKNDFPDLGSAYVNLYGGKQYPFRLEYFHRGYAKDKDAMLRLEWKKDYGGDWTVVPSEVFGPPIEMPGSGLKGSYFDDINNMTVGSEKVIRTDEQINFSWDKYDPDSQMEGDGKFAVVWEGKIQPLFDGDYDFFTSVNNNGEIESMTFSFDNIPRTPEDGSNNKYHVEDLKEGEKYNIRIEYYKNDGNQPSSRVTLKWESVDKKQSSQLVPPYCLFPPDEPYNITPKNDDIGLLAKYYNIKSDCINKTYWPRWPDSDAWPDPGKFFPADISPALEPPVKKRVNNLNFEWEAGSPDDSIGADYFISEWKGFIKLPDGKQARSYEFKLTADDGCSLFIGPGTTALINRWENRYSAPMTGKFYMEPNIKYEFYLRHFERGGSASVGAVLKWRPVFTEKSAAELEFEVIPPEAFTSINMPANDGKTIACKTELFTPTPPDVTDICGKLLTPTGPVISPIPECEGIVTYVWTYNDCEGNIYNWTYTFTISAPVVNLPPDGSITVPCKADANPPVPPVFYDNCGRKLDVKFIGEYIPLKWAWKCEGTVVWLYSYTDCVGKTYDWKYAVTVDYEDFKMPLDEIKTILTAGDIYTPTATVVYDNCGNLLEPTGPVINTESGRVKYVWTYTDCEGNSHDWAFNFSIINSGSANFGNTNIYSLASLSTVRRAMPVTFSEAGQIQSISVYHNAGSGNVLLGVYSDGAGFPSALLGVTPSTAVRTTAGWQTVTLTTPVPVSSGQKVWLTWVFQNVSNIRYERTGTPASVSTGGTWSSGLPSAFGTSWNGNFKFSVYCTYTTDAVPDVTKPIVTAFTIPATSASLIVPVSNFTATDNKAVTGFKLTETSAAPLVGDAGWTTVAPTSYTFATVGTKTLYAWAKDKAGNVSESVSAQVEILTKIGNTQTFGLASLSTVRRAIPVTFNEAGQIQSISVYHNAGSGNVILGVYSDVAGRPSELLGVSPSTAVRTTAGWQKVSLTTPVNVTSGQKVWLAWVFQNAPKIRYAITSAPASVSSSSTWSSGIPSTFGTSWNGNFKFSVYCTYIADNTKSAVIAGEIEPVFEKADLKVYPNPFSEKLRFEFVSPESVNACIDLYDMTGRIVKTIFEQPIEGGVNYEAEFRPETIISGMYIYRMTMGETVYNGKVVFKKE